MRNTFFLMLTVFSITIFGQVKTGKENRFAFDFFQKVSTLDSNTFFSPYSISCAMAMTYNGANEKTKKQITKAMYFNNDFKTTNSYYNKNNNTYKSYHGIDNFKLNIANALWVSNTIKIKGSFKKTMEKYYDASLYNEIDADKINKWADDNTNHMIPELVTKDDVSQAKVVLTNAIYFYGTWVQKFDPKNTKEEDFTTGKNEIIKTPMMRQTTKVKYAEYGSLKMVSLPYEGDKTEMILILSKEGYSFEQCLKEFTLSSFNSLYSSLQGRKLKLMIPKFKIETSYKLKEILMGMGMSLAFSPEADFSGIAKGLYIDQVIHKAVLDVSEEGTEAAAATAVIMKRSASLQTNFIANRPFIVIIKDKTTGNILFMGTIVNPNTMEE